MTLNEALVGRRYQAVSIAVDRERVAAFAEAIGEDHQRYRDEESPMAPPTFPTVLQILASARVAGDPELGLDYTRVVHGQQEYEWSRPVRVGDVLSAEPRIAEIYAKGSNEFLVVEAKITDGSGELVVVARSTLISRGTAQ